MQIFASFCKQIKIIQWNRSLEVVYDPFPYPNNFQESDG